MEFYFHILCFQAGAYINHDLHTLLTHSYSYHLIYIHFHINRIQSCCCKVGKSLYSPSFPTPKNMKSENRSLCRFSRLHPQETIQLFHQLTTETAKIEVRQGIQYTLILPPGSAGTETRHQECRTETAYVEKSHPLKQGRQ